jgi:hypothetical protein
MSSFPYFFCNYDKQLQVGCALTFVSEAEFEIEAKISFRLEAKIKQKIDKNVFLFT